MKYYVVDAFAERIFEGNPAGVCVLDEWPDEEKMAKIGMENNLSETAFAVKDERGYGIRWYTPGGEIDLCGHATLAAAYVINRFVEPESDTILFHTPQYELAVAKKGDIFELDFPAIELKKYHVFPELTEALGAEPAEVYLGRDLVVLLDSEETLKNLQPNFAKIKALKEGLAVFVTAAGEKYDFVSRAFWPKLDIDEDPVCGSMHCNLIPYWNMKTGKTRMVGRQMSSRGGTVYCEYRGDRVRVGGRAALYSIADICVDEKERS